MKKILLMCFVVAGIASSCAVADGGAAKNLMELKKILHRFDVQEEWSRDDKEMMDQLEKAIKKIEMAERVAPTNRAARKEKFSKNLD